MFGYPVVLTLSIHQHVVLIVHATANLYVKDFKNAITQPYETNINFE